ncbi:MAG: VWA domain-containing protein [Pyrinomonadaceae bacterium]
MKRIALLICLLYGPAALAAAGQTPTPTPGPTPEDVVKISTNLVQVDVVATDKNGRPVTDLKPNEVEIYENGQKQKIVGFNFVSDVRPATEPSKSGDKNAVPVPVPGHTLRPDQIHRTLALVVDDLSLSWESAYYTRRTLKKFVDEQVQDGDLVAIIRTGAGIGALQQFTSDKRVLYAAIDRVKWNPNGTGGMTAFAPINTQPPDPEDPSKDSSQGEGSGDQSLDDFRNSVFASGTLGALKYVVTGMAQLPGRKSVILFSDGFKIFETDASGFQSGGRVMDFLHVLIDAANRAAVTFYTIDSRGLQSTAFTAADNVGDTSTDAMNQAMQSRSDELHDTQDGLRFLASETGGFAIVNNNDLSGGVKRVLEDQSYYLVAYEPEGELFDPKKRKFNQLTVKVLRPGVEVRYRSGFFNITDAQKETAASKQTPAQQLQQALVSPFGVTGIDLRMNAVYGDDPKVGPFVRSLLHVNAKDLNFSDDKDGTKKATIEVLAMAFGDNGQVVDQLARGYNLSVKPEKLQPLLKDGFVYQFTFPIKKPGAYQFRVAIRDATGGAVGSASQFIQVPDLKRKALTVSSLIIQTVTADEWRRLESGDPRDMPSPSTDTALRRITGGGVLRYGYEIYNARSDGSKEPHLTARVRVFRDGKMFYEGKDAPVDLKSQNDLQHIHNAGAIAIGKTMQPGDYVLQVVVTDSLAKQKQQIATQFIEFEVVQ